MEEKVEIFWRNTPQACCNGPAGGKLVPPVQSFYYVCNFTVLCNLTLCLSCDVTQMDKVIIGLVLKTPRLQRRWNEERIKRNVMLHHNDHYYAVTRLPRMLFTVCLFNLVLWSGCIILPSKKQLYSFLVR